MQGAKKSKIRRVHLHKSANVKTIFEQIQKVHKNDASIDSKMVETN